MGSVTVVQSVGNGSASPQMLSSRSEQSVYGGTIYYKTYQFTATANPGWTFSEWKYRERSTTVSSGGSSMTSGWSSWYVFGFDNPITNEFYTEGVTDNSTTSYEWEISAVFVESTWPTVTTASDPAAGGTTTGGGTYAYGASCTISATAASGYRFVKWVCSDGREITDASYTFTVGSSLTFTAQFAEGTGMPLCDATSGEILCGSGGEILFDG